VLEGGRVKFKYSKPTLTSAASVRRWIVLACLGTPTLTLEQMSSSNNKHPNKAVL
jgi:hypothetical protein